MEVVNEPELDVVEIDWEAQAELVAEEDLDQGHHQDTDDGLPDGLVVLP